MYFRVILAQHRSKLVCGGARLCADMDFLGCASESSRQQNLGGINTNFRRLLLVHRDAIQQVHVTPSITARLLTDVFSDRGAPRRSAVRVAALARLESRHVPILVGQHTAALLPASFTGVTRKPHAAVEADEHPASFFVTPSEERVTGRSPFFGRPFAPDGRTLVRFILSRISPSRRSTRSLIPAAQDSISTSWDLPGQSTAIPKTADGAVEMMRQLKITRDTAVKARTTAMNTLKQIIVHALINDNYFGRSWEAEIGRFVDGARGV